jgi:AraC-like DNA-binding protein
LETIILIGSIIGIVNSFILIIYALTTKKGQKITNYIFAFLILMLTIRISKSIVVSFSYDLHDFLITIGLAGFLAIGPAYYLLFESIIREKFKITIKHLTHLAPALLLIALWFLIDDLRAEWDYWHLFYRLILLQYMIYMTITTFNVNLSGFNRKDLINQINILGYFLAAIWFLYLLNDVSGFPYISGAILYSIVIYFSLVIIINKGFIINNSNPKYKNTGLKEDEKNRILREFKNLIFEEKTYRSNTISLGLLSKKINTSTHALSQAINENFDKTFFELIAEARISEAKLLLKQNKNTKVSDIAFEIGYNSLSAFNTAFKKSTGLTPTKFRNEG